MKKNLALIALGFTSAFAIPLSRAVITGINIGIAQAKEEQAAKDAIVQMLHPVN